MRTFQTKFILAVVMLLYHSDNESILTGMLLYLMIYVVNLVCSLSASVSDAASSSPADSPETGCRAAERALPLPQHEVGQWSGLCIPAARPHMQPVRSHTYCTGAYWLVSLPKKIRLRCLIISGGRAVLLLSEYQWFDHNLCSQRVEVLLGKILNPSWLTTLHDRMLPM